ncbi:MAG: Nramp family divalent metal transporter, partial [Opitutales bacterium]
MRTGEPYPDRNASRFSALRRFFGFVGPGFLVSVGYMDPGNWATDLAGGSQYGYALLWVILLSNLMAILFQHLCVRLNVATGLDLAQACRERYSPLVGKFLWVAAQLGIVAMDLAELLGSAIALQILFGIPLFFGAIITALDVLVLLALTRLGFRWLEALVGVLVLTIAACIGVELLLAKPVVAELVRGFIPTTDVLTRPGMLFVALGIIGATVMPHNLYLHSSIVGSRDFGKSEEERREAMRFATWDSTLALSLAFFVNAGLLVLSAAAFHGRPEAVTDIREAHRLLDGVLGATFAGTLFAVALLASGQNATITGTMAGQIVMEGFLQIRLPDWKRRLLTRGLALIPAMATVILFGERATTNLLVLSQVVLSLQLPFAVIPLVWFCGRR